MDISEIKKIGHIPNNTIVNADCLEAMKYIPDKSIDCIICDLPYGTTDCSWDSIIPFDKLWEKYNRIIKNNGVICLFGSEPFSSYLRLHNIKHYKYDWIWRKNTSTGFQHAKNMPLKNYENISIFSNGSMGHKKLLGNKRMIYNPQGIIKIDKMRKASKNQWGGVVGNRPSHKEIFISEYTNYPLMVLDFNSETDTIHPTQKPVALLEYLIKTYSSENDLILDNCSGSGSLAIAAYSTKRNFICIEKNQEYYKKSVERLNNVQAQLRLF